MAFRDFTYPEVREELGLTLTDTDLYSNVPSVEPSIDFTERMQLGVELALGTNTEKARSEFMIAPVLLEVHRLLNRRFGVFAGLEFNVDSSRGLNGFCDFLIARSLMRSFLEAPVVAVVEAKNDNIVSGLGQCIAAMVAAREFNAKANPPLNETIHGVVTTGTNWRFLRLSGSLLTVDKKEYYLTDLARLLGILVHILTSTETPS